MLAMHDTNADISDIEPKRETPHPATRPPPQSAATNAAPTPSGKLPRRVDLPFLCAHPAHLIALGFGSGLSPIAPGSVGTLWAWGVWALLAPTPLQGAWLWSVGALVGWWASTLTAARLGSSDPGAIVIDEIVAFWLILWLLTPASLGMQCAAFVLFRFFDAVKPGPVRWADRVLHGPGARGALGIMWDDLVAAGCTLLTLALWLRVMA
ncbi:MAG: phosphatidylglycerophosphatase A [Burkholderiaceae bacterium]|jgi:phosphatidylglycerophosphatase A|nr:phosphatidylglycerophosphatase A [Burkholderiaceae bacterium]